MADVFQSVAGNYDTMNDFMSAGIHRLWKNDFVSMIDPSHGAQILDVAGGTGDIGFRLLDRLKTDTGYDGNVTILDINPAMLKVGESRAERMGLLGPHLCFKEGNAELLDIEDNSVDAYTIAFGIRNCTHIDKVLQEAYRVLRPGGRFSCLEFSQVHNPILKPIYELYSHYLIPEIGSLVANDRESYRYLVESIRRFPPQEEFVDMIRDAGFKTFGKGYSDLTFGVACMHSGFKL